MLSGYPYERHRPTDQCPCDQFAAVYKKIRIFLEYPDIPDNLHFKMDEA